MVLEQKWHDIQTCAVAFVLRFLFVLALATFSAHPVIAQAAAAAMVTDLQGKATISEAGRLRDAGILAELDAGAQVQLDAGATLVVLYLEAGDEYGFKGPALIVFRPAQPEVITGSTPEKRSLSMGQGVRIKPFGMGQGALVMRSIGSVSRIRLLGPTGTRLLETEPEFRWQGLQPGLKYQFDISDDTGRSLYATQLDATSFKLPAGVQLNEGASYTWEVSARLPDGRKTSSVGDFSVAASGLRAQAAALRSALSAPVSSRVAYAAWLNQMELKDEARKQWRVLSAERPDDARLKALAGQ